MKGRRIFDWRFAVALIAMMLVATACWGFVQRQRQVDGLVESLSATTAQVQRLNAQIDAQAAKSDQQRRQLRTQNRQVHAELTALLRYLRAHGIAIPRTALAPRPQSSGSTRPKAARGRHSEPRPSAPASPAPTATPTPPTPTPGPGIPDLCTVLPGLCP